MSPVHGVIIAGGQGQRLGGVRKADLRVGGRRLIERVAKALGPLESLIVAAGPADNSVPGLEDALTVGDLPAALGGPLAGLAAAVAQLQARGVVEGLLISAAVDTPFLPPGFVTVMHEGLDDAACAYATWQDQFYPPNALWRLEALQDLPGQVRINRSAPSLRALQREQGARVVDWTERMAENPFSNVNGMADLIALGHRAKRGPVSPLIHKSGN